MFFHFLGVIILYEIVTKTFYYRKSKLKLLDNIYCYRLCYSTMYMSVATGKNVVYDFKRFYLYPRQTFLRILCFTTKMRNKCAGKFRRGCSKYTRASCLYFVRIFGILSQSVCFKNLSRITNTRNH